MNFEYHKPCNKFSYRAIITKCGDYLKAGSSVRYGAEKFLKKHFLCIYTLSVVNTFYVTLLLLPQHTPEQVTGTQRILFASYILASRLCKRFAVIENPLQTNFF